MLPNKESVDGLLRLPPESLLAWVQQHSGTIDGSQDWQDLAYEASGRVDVDPSLTAEEYAALSTAAVLIWDRLGEISAKVIGSGSPTYNAMGQRAVMINRFGAQPGHPARDPAIIEDWFFRRLEVPLEEAISMSKNATNLSTEEFLRISTLKDCVRLMKSIQSQQVFRRRDELQRWYQLLGTSPG